MNANFYPGPSRVYSNVPEYLLEAYSEGIMSLNHRSDEFMEMIKKTKKLLYQKLDIPSDYQIAFISSATESWEIIAQSLTKKSSHHFYNGAFGEKWLQRASNLVETTGSQFDINTELPVGKLESTDVVCVTQNETSNGTQVTMESLEALRNATDQLICVDATSSMAGIQLDFSIADFWYASVQKCFGLPAGLGIMILSPNAVERAHEINDTLRYNSLPFVLDNWSKNQSPYTPNVLGLYLLFRTMELNKTIDLVDEKMSYRQSEWYTFLKELKQIEPLVENEKVRSKTVLALKNSNPAELINYASESGIVFGKGYGEWKDGTFRIANFPAIKKKEIIKAQKFLRRYA